MYLLQYGAEPSPKWISVRGAGDHLLWMPIIGVAAETDLGWILLETGIGRALLDDPPRRQIVYASVEQPWGVGEDPLVTALESVGLRPEDFVLAAVSHLHVDHAGGIQTLARAGVPIAIQSAELSFARARATLEQAYYEPDYAGSSIQWRELDGDAELAPGVWALATPGHTPGHMSYRVDLSETGTWLFAIDAACLGENIYERVPGGWTAEPKDKERIQKSLNRLIGESERLGARLVPGHDQAFWTAVKHPPGGHR